MTRSHPTQRAAAPRAAATWATPSGRKSVTCLATSAPSRRPGRPARRSRCRPGRAWRSSRRCAGAAACRPPSGDAPRRAVRGGPGTNRVSRTGRAAGSFPWPSGPTPRGRSGRHRPGASSPAPGPGPVPLQGAPRGPCAGAARGRRPGRPACRGRGSGRPPPPAARHIPRRRARSGGAGPGWPARSSRRPAGTPAAPDTPARPRRAAIRRRSSSRTSPTTPRTSWPPRAGWPSGARRPAGGPPPRHNCARDRPGRASACPWPAGPGA